MKRYKKISFFWHEQSVKARLWFCLIASGLIYFAFTLAFPLTRYYDTIPPVDYAKLTRHSWGGFVAYVVGIVALFIIYSLFLKLLPEEKKSVYFIFGGGILFSLIVVLSYPQTAIDMLVYAVRTRGWARYGLVPFSASTNAMPASDPWLGLAGEWGDTASPYGPIWEWLSLGMYYLSGRGYLAHLFALKILGMLAYLGSVWLLYQILLSFRPQQAVSGTAFFAWNPLVLLESVQNTHNDISMVFFILVAVWAFTKLLLPRNNERKKAYSVLFLVAFSASILTKFIPLLLLPFFLLAIASTEDTWPQKILTFLFYGLAIMLLVVLTMCPYWPGMDQWAVLYSGKSAGRSLIALMVLALQARLGTNTAFDYTQAIIYALLGGIYLWNLWRVWQASNKTPKDKNAPRNEIILTSVFLSSFYVLFWYELIGASTFHAWYLLWFLPFAALLRPKKRPTKASFVFSLTALLIIPYYEIIRVWIPLLLHNHFLGHLIGVSLMMVPVLLSLRNPGIGESGNQGRGTDRVSSILY